ncbi:MAG: DNA translocase FtsK 4TM domain-containing protein [Chloroflexota bacterium]|nr:DNA translocase FtsK 4TM domain-containing protein [Chloroflexota bacterium]
MIADFLLRPELWGLVLIAISALTLLSLLTDNRSSFIDRWIRFLNEMVGLGVWGVPLVAGALGLWVVIRAVEQMPDLPWQRPAGLTALFLAFITGAALVVTSTPAHAGGVIGSAIAAGLQSSLGVIGAWSVVSLIVVLASVLLTDQLLMHAAVDLWYRWHDWRRERMERRRSPIQPVLPIPSGTLPWWKRLKERFTGNRQKELPPNMVPANPPRVISEPLRRTPVTERPAPTPPSPAPSAPSPAKPPSRPDVLTPHIVGGAHEWRLPNMHDMLNDWERQVDSDDLIRRQGRLIQETLSLFGVPADFEGAYKGPSVTQYLIKPGYVERTVRGETQRVKVKVSKIAGLANDLALALAASSVRIEAPVPGTSYVGVEVPNHESNVVGLKELMESEAFQGLKGKLGFALGEDVKGQPIVSDLARMPHLLIAGATGSGKSVCINSIIACLLLSHTPDSLRLLMIDPKMVELSMYNGIPHLLSPVVTEIDRASGVLFWAVKEMERRYQLCSAANARDIERYNAYLLKRNEKPLPYIVIVVDEMADLMMASPEEVEKHICRIAQMARAVGIHLIVATQRPSVDVITGLIKANFPARIAFAVSSQVDSRVILDVPGAERLLGRGDMLFMAADASKLERIQGAWLSDEEIARIVRYWKGGRSLELDEEQNRYDGAALPPAAAPSEPVLTSPSDPLDTPPLTGSGATEPAPAQAQLFEEIDRMKAVQARDELFDDAVRIVQESGRGSVSLLQRKLRIGYSRSSRLVEQLEEAGILGPDLGGNQGRQLLARPPHNDSGEPPPHIIGGRDDHDTPRVWM